MLIGWVWVARSVTLLQVPVRGEPSSVLGRCLLGTAAAMWFVCQPGWPARGMPGAGGFRSAPLGGALGNGDMALAGPE